MSIANYITCPEGHVLKVIYDPQTKVYGFTCDECNVHALRGFCFQTDAILEVRVVGYGKPKSTLQ